MTINLSVKCLCTNLMQPFTFTTSLATLPCLSHHKTIYNWVNFVVAIISTANYDLNRTVLSAVQKRFFDETVSNSTLQGQLNEDRKSALREKLSFIIRSTEKDRDYRGTNSTAAVA